MFGFNEKNLSRTQLKLLAKIETYLEYDREISKAEGKMAEFDDDLTAFFSRMMGGAEAALIQDIQKASGGYITLEELEFLNHEFKSASDAVELHGTNSMDFYECLESILINS